MQAQPFGLEAIASQETPIFIKELSERETPSGLSGGKKENQSWLETVSVFFIKANMAPDRAVKKIKSASKEMAETRGIPSTSLHLPTEHKEKMDAIKAGGISYLAWHVLSDLKAFATGTNASNIFGQMQGCPFAAEFHKGLVGSVGTLPTGLGRANNDGDVLDLMTARAGRGL